MRAAAVAKPFAKRMSWRVGRGQGLGQRALSGVLAWVSFQAVAQLNYLPLNNETLRELAPSLSSLPLGDLGGQFGGQLDPQLQQQLSGLLQGVQQSGQGNPLEGLNAVNPSEIESLIQQYSGLLSPDQASQLRSFLDANPDVGTVAEELGGQIDAVAGDAETFEAAPTEAEENVEPLFLNRGRQTSRLPRFGEAEGRVSTDLQPFLSVPFVFQNGDFNYDTADLALRPLFIDLQSIQILSLFTDNLRLASEDEESDILLATNFDFSVILQISESFRLATGATLVYLPRTNELGFSALGPAGLRSGVIGQTEVVYDIPLGHSDLSFYDNFRVQNYSFAFGRDVSFTYFNQDRNQGGLFERSLNGVGGAGDVALSGVGLAALQQDNAERFEASGTEFRNTVGGVFSRLFPGDNRLEINAAHSDSWFTGQGFGLPRSQDQVGLSLASERENTRFKPTLSHSYYRTNLRPGWDSISSLAFQGPATDYIDLALRLGYYIPGNLDQNSVLWGFDIGHNPTPNLYHSFFVQRGAAGPSIDLAQSLGWRVTWTVGPRTGLDFLVERRELLDLDGDGSGNKDFRVGTILTQDLGEGFVGTFGVIRRNLQFASSAFGKSKIWTTRAHFQKALTESLDLGLTFQWERWDSNVARFGYVENLVILSLTKRL